MCVTARDKNILTGNLLTRYISLYKSVEVNSEIHKENQIKSAAEEAAMSLFCDCSLHGVKGLSRKCQVRAVR